MSMFTIALVVTLGTYSVLSKILFDNIYRHSKLIIDEEFHLPLGAKYCNFNFDKWDPKVTTLPGLYLLSALLLGYLELCSIYWLRATSLFCSCINLILFYIIFSYHTKRKYQKVFSALTMTLLPPLYFLSHIYYTDVVSLTTNLLVILLCEKGHHYPASITGFLSILCRQTNVIFVMIYGGQYIITRLYAIWAQKQGRSRKDGNLPAKNLKPFILDCAHNPIEILKSMSVQVWLNSMCYISVILSFITFVWLNGSIVVGDKSAHTVAVHIPQLFYFSLFCLVFGWPHFVGEVTNFMLFARRHTSLIGIFAVTTLIVIHYNTVVHPYLLADNRHFVFYIWNRFYGRFWWFRYVMTPVYIFSLYVIFKIIWDKTDISFFLLYVPGVTLLLCSQSLLEFRYFLAPYIILRLRIKNRDSAVFNVVLEFITYCLINMMAFNIFFTRSLTWDNYIYPQRIIW